MRTPIYIANDNLVDITEVKDESDNTYINDAAVTCTLKDARGVNVVGQDWPATAVYVSGSDGRYQATLEDSLVLEAGYQYKLHIDIDAGADVLYHREIDCIADVRQ